MGYRGFSSRSESPALPPRIIAVRLRILVRLPAISIDYDVIIIGTGPGGGTLAYRLAPSGKKILLLEWGDYLPREKDNWSSKTVFIDNKYKAKETWKDKDGGRFTPASTTTSVGFRRSTARPLRTNPESKSYPTTGRGAATRPSTCRSA